MRKVLVLEDEASIRDFLAINLRRAGYFVLEADTGERAIELFDSDKSIDIAVLDVMLPGIDGFEVCRQMRTKNRRMGIIMLSARTQEMDKVGGLMLGADDYMTKPFSPAELVARVDALSRRIGGIAADEDIILSGQFRLDKRSRTIEKDGKRLDLTQMEYAVLKYFMENPEKAMSREAILSAVWGGEYYGELKIVDVNVRRLRLKIEADPATPRYIQTVWGFGYKWQT